MKLLHSVSDACALLGIGRTTLYALLNDGSLEARKVGRRTFLTQKSLQVFIESRPKLQGAGGKDVSSIGSGQNE
jgi:excisionase family DNA binding protein